MTDLDALEAEIAAVGGFLDGLAVPDWERPTRCPPMTVRVMAAHVLRHADQLRDYPREDAAAEKDAVSYYAYDPPTIAAGVLARAEERAGGLTPAELLDQWRRLWPAGVAAARADWERNPTLRAPLGLISLREFVRTRVVEATVHHMDLRDALGRDAEPVAAALDGTIRVLEGLLGASRGDASLGPIDFVLSGTGRRPLSDSERDRLGPLAERFPLLA